MAEPLSKARIDKLGEQLRGSESIDAVALALLQDFRAGHEAALASVQSVLAEKVGVQSTSRLKTVNTIVEKLKRERVRLSQMQDVAGVRTVLDGGLHDQDLLVGAIQRIYPEARTVDRRDRPSHGYRAVHVIVRVGERAVEVQVRTVLQDLWAQALERLADRVGREIRYGVVVPDERVVRLMRTSRIVDVLEKSIEKRRLLLSSPAHKAPAGQRQRHLLLAQLKEQAVNERAEIRAILEAAMRDVGD